MRIPKKDIAGFASDIIDKCYVSRKERIQRGAMYRNLFLTGDEGGEPQAYNKCWSYIDNLSAYLYSPVELRFSIEHYGFPTAVERAMEDAASSELHRYIRQGNVDTEIESAVTWGLVKGNCFIKLLWGEDGFEPWVIQPEMMGVLREDIDGLDRQEAFVHSTYYTIDRFAQLVENNEDRDAIMRKVKKYISPSGDDDSPAKQNNLKDVIIGGMNPYKVAGGGNNDRRGKNMVQWLEGPSPTLAPSVLNSLIRLDELWVWDDNRDDWTTIQQVGNDVIIAGKDTHRNLFADAFDPDNEKRRTKENPLNPLSGKHPFIEICPNKMDGYFWGRSELCNVALLQKSINVRINGINGLMRMQENPPRYFKGSQGVTQSTYAKLNKPGGYLVDNSPNSTLTTLAPEMPSHIFESLHEYEQQFNDMAGFPPIMQGKGSSGVRSEGHADALTRNASPRFKDRALLIERQVESLGGLALDILKAKIAEEQTCYVEEKKAGIFAGLMPKNWLEESPVPGMKPVPFLFSQLPTKCKLVIDSHSSSPAFKADSEQLLMQLFKIGAISPEQVVMHTHPPGQDTILEELKANKIAKEQFAEKHPEIAAKAESKKKK